MKAFAIVGNYEYVIPMLKDTGITKVIFITVFYHMSRSYAFAHAVFENKGFNGEVIGVAGINDFNIGIHAKHMTMERHAVTVNLLELQII